MHGRGSRYRDVGETTRDDASGRSVPAVELRLPEPVDGVITHVVTADDRLDRLAMRYYGRPRDWWRIVDANRGVLSPLELLGEDAVRTARARMTGEPEDGEWYRVLDAVRPLTGVEDVAIVLPPTVPEPELVVRLNVVSRDPAEVLAAVAAVVGCGPLALDVRLGATVAVPARGRP